MTVAAERRRVVGDRSRRFLLKVWREPGEGPTWRAALRDVTDGTLHEFEATEALIDYLVALDDGAADEGEWRTELLEE